jgi:hypothetical protein
MTTAVLTERDISLTKRVVAQVTRALAGAP